MFHYVGMNNDAFVTFTYLQSLRKIGIGIFISKSGIIKKVFSKICKNFRSITIKFLEAFT